MESASHETLKEKTAKGIFWGGMSNGLQQLLNLVFGIFLGRLLSPSDYGMVGMLTIFSLIASSLQESGFTAALANKKEISHRHLNAVFWFSIGVSGSLYILLFFSAPWIAGFYHTPELTALARYQFLGFFISSMSTAHFAKLFHDMKVKQRTIATFTALCISGVIGVTLAFLGFSYWGIATQNISYILITTCFFWYFSGWRPTLQFDFGPIREMFGFSCKLLVTNIFNHINNNVFSVILGKFFNGQTVGYYNQGNKWTTMGQNFITGMVNSVAQPVLAQVSDDKERQYRVFRRMFQFTALVSFPVMLGLSAVSQELIILLITDKWLESAYILCILCLGGAFLPIAQLYGQLLISRGCSTLYMGSTVALGVLQLVLMLFMYPYGIHTMLYVYVAVNILWLGVWHTLADRQVKLPSLALLLDGVQYLAAALLMLWALNQFTFLGNLYVRFAVKVLAALMLYPALILLTPQRSVLLECIGFLFKKLKK